MKVHRSHRLELDLPGGTAAQLQAYLSEPARPLKALLNRKKVQQAEGGRFHYISRPYSLLMFRIQPEVIFRARWIDTCLQIEFVVPIKALLDKNSPGLRSCDAQGCSKALMALSSSW